MKPILLDGPIDRDVTIEMVDGPKPYLGVKINSNHWHPLRDKDLKRLKRAIEKCIEKNEKRPGESDG